MSPCSGRVDRAVAGVVLVLSACLTAAIVLPHLAADLVRPGALLRSDFFGYWVAVKAAMAGHVGQVYDLAFMRRFEQGLGHGEEMGFLPYFYPPHFLALLWPFGWMSYRAAAALWLVLSLAVYVSLAQAGFRPTWKRALALVAVPAALAPLMYLQVTLLVAGLLAGGLALLRRRPLLAGVLLGLATVKPHLVLLAGVALVSSRSWRALAAMAVTVAVLILVSALWFGPQVWLEWGRSLHAAATFNLEQLHITGKCFPTVTATLVRMGHDADAAAAAQGLAAVAAAVAVWWAYRRPPSRMQPAMVLAAALMVTPYARLYDLAPFAVATLLVAEEALCSRQGALRGDRIVLVCLWIFPIVADFLTPSVPPLPVLVQAALIVLIIRRLRAGTVPPDAGRT